MGSTSDFADAVILISGGRGVSKVHTMAIRANKPVLPVASTGRSATKAYRAILKNWHDRPVRGLTAEQFQSLDGPLPGVVERLVSLLEGIFREGQATAPDPGPGDDDATGQGPSIP